MSNATLIMFITMLILVSAGVAVLYEVNSGVRQQARNVNAASQAQSAGSTSTGGLQLVNTVGTDIKDDGFNYVQMQVKYDGNDKLNLNDTHFQIKTSKSLADLQYRNGTTSRDVDNGFYTQ